MTPLVEAGVSDLALTLAIALYALIFLALFAYAVNFLYLTWTALRLPADRPVATASDALPRVTVQLPVFNEIYVVERAIEAAVRLDYPPDRLEIQVLDDSTDDTSELVERLVTRWQALGVDIRHLRRRDRTGFKAGALAAGLSSAKGTLIAIFDADFVPRSDFLLTAVPVLMTDPGLAFVQARWGHTNRDRSMLTRLQALSIDGHFAIEQRARSGAGYWFNFNGTAGIWRRAAVVDAGGWRADTLTEDLDLSYRAFESGWRGVYLDGLEVPAELPVGINAYRRQQHRWARGSFECARRHLPRIWRSPASLPVKLEATLHLTGYAIPVLLLALCFVYPFVLIGAAAHPRLLWTVGWLSIVNLLIPVPGILAAAGQRRLDRSWPRAVPQIAMLSVLGAGMMVNAARAGWQALIGTPATFERTPKFGGADTSGDWKRLRYQVAIDRIVVLELAIAALDGMTSWTAARLGLWPIAFYAGVFTIGLVYVVALTIRQTVGAATASRLAPRRAGFAPVHAGPPEPSGPIPAPGAGPRGA